MSASETVPPVNRLASIGLAVQRSVFCDTYNGTKAELIAAGLVRDGMFPGDPGRGKTMATYWPDGSPVKRGGGINGERMRVHRISRSRFEVQLWVPKAESRRRREAEREQDRHSDDTHKAAVESQRRLNSLKNSAEEFRAAAVESASIFLPLVMQGAKGEHGRVLGGHRLDDETCRQIGHHIDSIRRLMHTGRVVFDKAARDTHARWCGEPLRKADPGFDALLSRVAKVSASPSAD